MNKEVVSNKQAISTMILFIWGSTIIIGTGGEAKKDMWLAIMVAMFLGILISIIYSKILYMHPGKNLFEINQAVFGKIIGRAINMPYIWFAFHLSALVVNNFDEFISSVGLPDTPRAVPVFFIVVLCIWGVKEGVELLGRWSKPFVILLIMIMIMTISLSVNIINLDNIRPILQDGVRPLMKGTASAFTFPFAETIIFLMIIPYEKGVNSPFKIFLVSMLIGGAFLITISARNIMVIGVEELSRNYFPSYTVVSRINIGDFIQRIETAVMVAFVIGGFVKVSCCILAVCNGVSAILNFKDYRFIVIPISLMVMACSFRVYESIIETTKWVPKYWPIYASIFQVILPMITFIGVMMKGKGNKKSRGN